MLLIAESSVPGRAISRQFEHNRPLFRSLADPVDEKSWRDRATICSIAALSDDANFDIMLTCSIENWQQAAQEDRMKVFVTGFEGYVGSHAVRALQTRGAQISALTRNAESAERAEDLGLAPVMASLDVPSSLADAASDADAVAHFAASDRPEFLPINVAAVDAMMGSLKPGRVFLTHGGTMVFGEQGRQTPALHPKFAPPPPLAGRALLDQSILDRRRDGVRPFVVYGAFVFGGKGAMIPNVLAAAASASGLAAYPGDGSAIWSGVHIEDWADLMARVALSDDPGGTPIFAAAQDIEIASAATALANAIGPSVNTKSVSIEEARGLWPFFADGLTLYQRFDGDDARDRFGWAPRTRSLEAAFADALSQT